MNEDIVTTHHVAVTIGDNVPSDPLWLGDTYHAPANEELTPLVLTEDRVRAIVREEIAKMRASKSEVSKLVDVIGAEIGRRMQMQALTWRIE